MWLRYDHRSHSTEGPLYVNFLYNIAALVVQRGVASNDQSGPEGSGKELLLSVLGELLLPNGGSAWTSTLVAVLAELGISDRNARQAIARLADGGTLRNERLGRRARWHLTREAEEFLTKGAERIYGFGSDSDSWDGHWLMLMCSVPEDQRADRPRLRSRLGFEGFGFLAPGIAICAHIDREAAAARVLHDLGLLADAVLLRSEASPLSPDATLIERAWDLASLGDTYSEFIARFHQRRPTSDPQRCAAVVELVHAWRRFPSIDPELPARLLPRRWQGHRAKDVFDDCRARWTPGATRWFLKLEHEAAD